MKKLKFFVTVLRRSLTDFSYYKEIRKARFWFSFKYLLFLTYLISLLWGIIWGAKAAALLPKAPKIISEAKVAISEFYPSELVLVLKGGKLATNVPEPYYIEFPHQLGFPKMGAVEHFITIDTAADVANYSEYKTLILLSGDSLVAPDNNGVGYRLIPLSEAKTDLIVTKAIYDGFVGLLTPYLDYLPYVLYVLIAALLLVVPPVVAVFSLGSRMLMVGIASLILLLVARVMKKELKLGEIYRLSMHGVTLPILLSFAAALTGVVLPGILVFITLLVFMGVVIRKI